MIKFASIFVVLIILFVGANYYMQNSKNNESTLSPSAGKYLYTGQSDYVKADDLLPVSADDPENDPKELDLRESTTYKVTQQEEPPVVTEPKEVVPSEQNGYDLEFLYEISPGVNLAGAEFAPNDENYQHIYPTSSLQYYHDKRVRLIRLPFLWERMQPSLGAALDPNEIAMMTEFLDQAAQLDMYVILDLHNYARYRGDVVGTENVPTSALIDLWERMIDQFKDHPAVVAYGLMNEPHDTGSTWRDVAQELVTEIRKKDTDTILLVAGDHWSGAYSWQSVNSNMLINDPSNKVVYEAHVYFDGWNVGAYNCTYDNCGVTDSLVSERIDPFLSWLDQNDAYGFIGEYGVPSDDSRWIDIIDEFYTKLDNNKIGSTMWAGGPNWGNYTLSIEPQRSNGKVVSEKPQMKYLEKHLVDCDKLGNSVKPQCIVRIK